MGFFSGLAEGFRTGRQMKAEQEERDALAKYRQQEFEYRASRDEVADQRYVDEIKYNRDRNTELDSRYEEELKYNRGRDSVADKRYEDEQTYRKERDAVADERYTSETTRKTEVEDRGFGLEERRVELAEDAQGTQVDQWQQAFDYKKNRDSVGDERYLEEQKRIREEAAESKRRFEREFGFKQGEANRAADRWRTKFDYDKDRALTEDDWRQAMQDYRVSRDIMSDQQWSQQFEYTQEQATQAQANYRERMGFDRSVQLSQQQRWEAEMEWRKERADVADEQFAAGMEERRETEIIKAGGLSILTGQGGRPDPKKASASVMKDSAIALKKRVGDMGDMSAEDKKYFETVLADPAASHQIYEFIQDQAAEGNVIAVEDIPSVIEIAGLIEGKGEEAMQALQANGIDVSNSKTFLKDLATLKEYTPSRLVLDIKPDAFKGVGSIEDMKKQRDLFAAQTVPYAQMLIDNGHPNSAELAYALRGIDDSNELVKSKAMNTLLKHAANPDMISRLEKSGGAFKGLSSNEFLLPYVDVQDPAETPMGTGSVKLDGKDGVGGPVVSTTEAALGSVGGSDEAPSFTSFADVEAWRSEGNSGPVTVGGKVYNIEPTAEAKPELDIIEPSNRGIISGKTPSEKFFGPGVISGKTPGEKMGLGNPGSEPKPESELESLKNMVKDVEIADTDELRTVVNSFTSDKEKRAELFEALKEELGL